MIESSVYYSGRDYIIIPNNADIVECICENTLLIMYNNNLYNDYRITVHGIKAFKNEIIHNTYEINKINAYDKEFFLKCFEEHDKIKNNLDEIQLNKLTKVENLLNYIFNNDTYKANFILEELTQGNFHIEHNKIFNVDKNEQYCVYDIIKYIIRNEV